MKSLLLLLVLTSLTGCAKGDAMQILEGATHACGTLHVEGYFTDTQGDVVIAKAPVTWTPEQVQKFCAEQGR